MNAPPAETRTPIRKRLVRIVIGLLICYAIIVLLMWLLENRLVFRPTTAAQYWEPPPSETISDLWLALDDGTAIHAWVVAPPDAEGALLMCHGNGGNLSYYGKRLLLYAKELNRTILVFDYPGYGKSDGKPTEASCYATGEAAFRWLTDERHIPADRIVLMGESLGGGVAVELATRHDHEALVLVKTFTSVPDAAKSRFPWLPTRWLMSNRFDNLRKIRSHDRPVLIAGATEDTTIPFAHSEKLFAATNEPKSFLRFEGGHNDPMPADFLPQLRQFLDQN